MNINLETLEVPEFLLDKNDSVFDKKAIYNHENLNYIVYFHN